jgi:hypothetical protein
VRALMQTKTDRKKPSRAPGRPRQNFDKSDPRY